MSKTVEKIFLLLIDFITINLAFVVWTRLRSSMHLFVAGDPTLMIKISLIIYAFWLLLFLFMGVYRSWYTQSRFDEVLAILKAVSVGIVLIFIFTFEPEQDLSSTPSLGRVMILTYWLTMAVFVGGGRLLLHTVERSLLIAGIGQRNTLIVGWSDCARDLADRVRKYPALGHRVVGFVSLKKSEAEGEHDGIPVLGHMRQLETIVEQQQIEDVILCLGNTSHKKVIEVIGLCEGLPVKIKIEPDMYSIILGQARTQQIYGFPLIEIHPEIMQPWERKVKRLIDVLVSLTALILLAPLLILTSILIKIESRGPIFFRQKRVGRNSKMFTVLKFRSMIKDAEKYTGPVWAGQNDPRITRIGRIMRKTRIDEFPQLFNVLSGDMSLVGPRPERPYFVEKLKREYPYYTRRLRVKPGITGWAQVKGKYDTTIEAAREKLEFDLYYIDNLSLRLDFRIMVYTVMVMIRFKGQ